MVVCRRNYEETCDCVACTEHRDRLAEEAERDER